METILGTGSNAPRNIAVTKYFIKTPARPTYFLSIVCGTVAFLGAIPLGYFLWVTAKSPRGWSADCSSCLSIFLMGWVGSFALITVVSFVTNRNRYRRAWHAAEPKPTDSQIDAWHKSDLERLKKHAMNKLDMSPEQVEVDNPNGPLTVEGPGPSASTRSGFDHIIRFSAHEILIIYLDKYHLASYKCIVDLVDGLVKTETTQEYHYADVVSVSTQTENSSLTWFLDGSPLQFPSYQKFALSVASGEEISVAISPNAAEIMHGNSMPDSGADRTIKAIRARLREKKGGTMDSGRGADPSVL
jgi:hypothetical protein